ncbi:MAG TPA: hypothetical protein DIS75_07400, partial [Chryseobacterium sp.]|nr:hypothetical protein [Chryseobacterium sp.]
INNYLIINDKYTKILNNNQKKSASVVRRILFVHLPKKYDRKSSLWETKKTSNWNYFFWNLF